MSKRLTGKQEHGIGVMLCGMVAVLQEATGASRDEIYGCLVALAIEEAQPNTRKREM